MDQPTGDDSEIGPLLHIIDELRRERVRLRVAYIRLFNQYLELDDICREREGT